MKGKQSMTFCSSFDWVLSSIHTEIIWMNHSTPTAQEFVSTVIFLLICSWDQTRLSLSLLSGRLPLASKNNQNHALTVTQLSKWIFQKRMNRPLVIWPSVVLLLYALLVYYSVRIFLVFLSCLLFHLHFSLFRLVCPSFFLSYLLLVICFALLFHFVFTR